MLAQRAIEAPPGSYTRRLMDDPALLRAKLIEEAGELADAKDPCHVAEEASDVAYFTLVRAAAAGVSLLDIDRVLDRRSLRVSRRQGDSKPITEPTP
jgi:phosphoribosyl-ATP pyrophosphohydrolase